MARLDAHSMARKVEVEVVGIGNGMWRPVLIVTRVERTVVTLNYSSIEEALRFGNELKAIIESFPVESLSKTPEPVEPSKDPTPHCSEAPTDDTVRGSARFPARTEGNV